MKDQHTKIKGYRDLSQIEIDLMNEIKAHGEKTRELFERVDYHSLPDSEAKRCLALAKTNLQQGFMWWVRSVALPDSF